MVAENPYRDFFLNPILPRHRRYEVLRARFIEEKPITQIAHTFGLTFYTVQSIIRDFKNELDKQLPSPFFIQSAPGPKNDRKKSAIRDHVVRLRARGYASTDIHKALRLAQFKVSLSLVDHVLRAEGLTGLTKRSRKQRKRIIDEINSRQIPGLTIPSQATPARAKVADVRKLDLTTGRIEHTPLAGAFLFLPFLLQTHIHTIVTHARMVGTKMIPAQSYFLSSLLLKLLDKERKSHVTDWNFDSGLALFAGLNVIPKTTVMTDYSYRLVDNQHNELLSYWIKNVYPILCPQGVSSFAIDFHSIAHRSTESELQNHYVASRGKALPSILCCFARSIDTPMLCYANADITTGEKPMMVSTFVDYWKDITGVKPDWLYFDSKMTTYKQLNLLNTDPEKKTNFITIRRRGASFIKKILNTPDTQWQNAVIDTPKRRHQRIKLLDTKVKLSDYEGNCRQVAVKGLGRATPTPFLTNNNDITAREVVLRYTKRNYIENDIGINVNFFHMDCLSSQIRLNVNFDVVLTVIANGCYRWLSRNLKGCEKMEPKQLYRKFIATPGDICIKEKTIDVFFDRRSHNPILAQAKLDNDPKPIPWLGNKSVRFFYS